MNKKVKRKFAAIMAAVMASSLTAPVTVVNADVISDAKAEKEKAEKALSELNDRMGGIRDKQKELQEKIDEADAELVQILYDIDILEDEIKEKKKEIKATQKDLDAAKKEEQEQLEAMKLRIKYMYENNGESISTSLLEGNDTSAVLNKATLFNDMYDYDRKMLDEYEKAKNKVEEIMAKLDEEKSQLEEKEDSLIEQKEELEKKMDSDRKTSANYDKEVEDAKKLAKQYRDTINEQNKIIEKQIYLMYNNSSSIGAYDRSYVAPGSGKGAEIANYALQFLGNPYVYGGTSLTNGIDCSGFTQAVYAHFGYSLPRSSASQRSAGRAVSASELQPGDLICYSGHVAMYIGDGKIVHASNKRDGIKISNNIGYRSIITFRRIVE